MIDGLVAGSEDHRRGFRSIVYLLIGLVIVPTTLLLALGILMLVFRHSDLNLLFGILVVSFVLCLVTGAVLLLVFVYKEAKLSKLQLDFVSKVSHELRTPLTSIRMFVEMLRDVSASERDVCLDVIEKETIRLTERIERLLDWGRMESGRQTYEIRLDSADAVITDALAAFDATTIGRRHDIAVEIPEDLPPIMVDRAAMVDALVNLLSNAVKYSQQEVKISLKVGLDSKFWRLSVRDEGIGIPRGEHKRIFEKFYRVDERLSRAVEGTGLGLAIVRHVALAHGGRIEVQSTPGKGSTFTIVLPRPSDKELRSKSEAPVAVPG